MSPFGPFRGGVAKWGQCPLFLPFFFTGERPLAKLVKFTGSNYGTHVCDCHYEPDGCMEEETMHNTCNCDAKLPIDLNDTGDNFSIFS